MYVWVIVLVLITGYNVAEGSQNTTIIVSDNDWQPYYFAGKEREPKGFAKEIYETCLKKMGYNPVFKALPIERMNRDMETGNIDINSYSYTPEREKLFEFGKQVLFVETYKPVAVKGKKIKIKSYADMDAYKLAHINGLKYSSEFLTYILKRVEEKKSDTISSTNSALDMLLAPSPRIDMFVNTENSVRWILKQRGLQNKVQIINFPIKTGKYFIALSKASSRVANKGKFVKEFDACVLRLKENGEFQKKAKHYRLVKVKNN